MYRKLSFLTKEDFPEHIAFPAPIKNELCDK